MNFQQEINFNNVSFQYPENKKIILKNLNLKISKGDFIGIIGESGSGKTTLINLLCGLLGPSQGSISYDQKNLSDHSINKIIGYVPQDIFLIEDSIKHNIAFGVNYHEIDEKKNL